MAETPQNLGDNQQKSPSIPITMKVDAPTEDFKQEVADNEKNADKEELKICSPSKKEATNQAKVNPFANSTNKLASSRGGILKAPQLSLNNTSSSQKPSFILNPSRLNPFGDVSTSTNSDNNKEDKNSTQSNGETLKFVPLIQSNSKSNNTQTKTTAASTSTTPTVSSFVFGQNLQDRVVATESKATDDPKPSTSLNSNGTSEMLFSSAVKNNDNSKPAPSDSSKSLSESAREYEESRANKRKYEQVEVITGEEGETNILNITCKLFAFDKASGNWQERGRGVLRLNDLDGDGHTQSRLVFRTTGSLRVVLNTKIWAEMTVEQAGEKSVRFTALDGNGAIKVFLAMASHEDSRQLFSQLRLRVEKEVTCQKSKKLNTTTDRGDTGDK